jgi:hypothetical protein
MNAERLHAIALAVLEDIKTTKSQETLKQLVGALQNAVNQPNAPQFQEQIGNYRNELNTSLSTAPSNDFSPVWKQAIRELGLHDILGQNLQTKIEEIFTRNQITLSVALGDVQKLQSQLVAEKEALEKVVSSFKLMNIGAEELQPGQCEIGVLIPRPSVDNKLLLFAKELEDFNGIFGVFAELATGERPGFELRSVSSTDLMVFVWASLGVASTISLVVDRIVNTYKNILEIRILHGKLKDTGVPEKGLEGVAEYARSIMEQEIEKLIKDLLKKYQKKDEPRDNELANELRINLNKIANRIDSGYNIDVRTKPFSEEEEAKKKVTPQDKAYINTILSASKSFEFIKLEGRPILGLPESRPKRETKDDKTGDKTND